MSFPYLCDLLGILVIAMAATVLDGTLRDVVLSHHPVNWVRDHHPHCGRPNRCNIGHPLDADVRTALGATALSSALCTAPKYRDSLGENV